MRLTMKERMAVTAVLRTRYRRASKKHKGRLLDELVGLTGYNRRYAAALLGERGGSAVGLPSGSSSERGNGRGSTMRRRSRRYARYGRSWTASAASAWRRCYRRWSRCLSGTASSRSSRIPGRSSSRSVR